MAEDGNDYKDSFMKMASSAFTASKTGWTRARQFTEERIGSAEKTVYDAQFENLNLRADRTKNITEKLLRQGEAMVQPNPSVRIEEYMYEKLDKKNPPRPTNAFILGQTMQDASQDIGPGTAYGSALSQCGGTMKKMGNAEKDFMQKSMSHFLHPLKSFLDNEMKTIMKEKRALEVKRLDLDACKNKVKKSQTPEKMRQAESELRAAQSDFDRQQEITRLLLEGVSTAHGNHLTALHSYVEALGTYHQQCQSYINELQQTLEKPLSTDRPSIPSAPSLAVDHSPSHQSQQEPLLTRRARVLYDYDAADSSELSLLADEVVNVYSIEGMHSDYMMAQRGQQKGKVPISYLELL